MRAARTFPKQLRHERVELPAIVEPMLATSGAALPNDDANWSYEYKWDGVRCIARWDGSNLNLYSRNLLNITARYPELAGLGEALGPRNKVMLDGEIIAVDENDQPSFSLLQRRMHVRLPSERLIGQVPIYFVVFDLLHLNRESTLGMPLLARQELLQSVTVAGPSWHLSPTYVGGGRSILHNAQSAQLEGIVAKRIDSIYEAGRRSSQWLKIKLAMRQEFVIGGWTPQEGTLSTLGALQVGYYDAAGRLRYAGSVGSGFNAAIRSELQKALGRLSARTNPFADELPRGDVRFVVPSLVPEIEYRRWPANGLIQHSVYKGLRHDKPAREVRRDETLDGRMP